MTGALRVEERPETARPEQREPDAQRLRRRVVDADGCADEHDGGEQQRPAGQLPHFGALRSVTAAKNAASEPSVECLTIGTPSACQSPSICHATPFSSTTYARPVPTP